MADIKVSQLNDGVVDSSSYLLESNTGVSYKAKASDKKVGNSSNIVTERDSSDDIGNCYRLWRLCSKSRDCICDRCKVVTKNERSICILAFESSVPRSRSNQTLTFEQSVNTSWCNRSLTAGYFENDLPFVSSSRKKILQEI